MSTSRLSQSQLGEYIDMAYLSHPYHQANYAKRLESLHGANSLYPLFGKSKPRDAATIAHLRKNDPSYEESSYLIEGLTSTPKAPIPWNQASRNSAGFRYDPSLVQRTIGIASPDDLAEFDPRYLHGSQPSVTSEGVHHYLQNSQKGPLFADQHDIGNQYPFVYIHNPSGEMRLIGGHHRAASALLKGEPVVARYAIGDY